MYKEYKCLVLSGINRFLNLRPIDVGLEQSVFWVPDFFLGVDRVVDSTLLCVIKHGHA